MIRFSLDHPTLRLAAASASAVHCESSPPDLVERMRVAALRVQRDPTAFPEAVRVAIRDVLRVGGYKPSGRGKPASEFLHAVACEQGLPVVNNLVDINNLVSLGTALPISTGLPSSTMASWNVPHTSQRRLSPSSHSPRTARGVSFLSRIGPFPNCPQITGSKYPKPGRFDAFHRAKGGHLWTSS